MQDFHTRVEGGVSGEDLAQLLARVFQAGKEQEDAEGADRAAQSAVRKLEIKVDIPVACRLVVRCANSYTYQECS